MSVNNPDLFARWNQWLRCSPSSNRLPWDCRRWFPNTLLRLFRRIHLKAANPWVLFDVRLHRTCDSGVG